MFQEINQRGSFVVKQKKIKKVDKKDNIQSGTKG